MLQELVFLILSPSNRFILFIASWQISKRSLPIVFNIKSIGFINLTGVTVDIPGEVNFYINKVTFGSSLVSARFRSHLVIFLEGVEVTFEPDFGSGIIERNLAVPSSTPVRVNIARDNDQDSWKAWIDNLLGGFVCCVDAKDLRVQSTQFQLKISTAKGDFKSNLIKVILNDSLINSRDPLTVQEINDTTDEGSKHRCLSFSYFEFSLNRELNEQRYVFREDIFFQWNPLLHLTVINVIKSVKHLIRSFKKQSPPVSVSSSPLHQTSSKNKLIHLDLHGNISVGALLSNDGQTFELKSSSCSVTIPAKGRFSLKSDSIVMLFDSHIIAKFYKNSILFLPENEAICLINREDFVGANFVTKKNRVLGICMERVKVIFPYKYDFADTFNEHFMSCIKWLRLLHRSPSSDSIISVAFDLAIDINHVCLEIEDDPFEVKLRNNYELLEDEMKEDIKRQQALNERLEQLRMNITEKLMNKMKQDLEAKKHEIYIKRHRQLYECSTRKYNIFTVQADKLKVRLAADQSLTGHDKLVRIMKQDLDPMTPFPDDIRFNTIWCRQIIGKIDNLVCKLRNFPQNMMDMTKMSVSGRILGAEQEAPPRSRRICRVDLGPERDSIKIERTMPSLKIYHDIKFKQDTLNYTHGSAWDPVLAQLSLCFENIVKPSRDPSPGLSWWDKMRHLFHGRVIFDTKELSLFFHGSLDPYNTTEMLEIAFTKSTIDILTGKILILGNVDFLVHTASKYDECRIVYLPNIGAVIYLNWECLGNPYDHHSAIPCAPDKVPEYSSNQQHDSYRAFRSHRLNVKLSLESKASSEADIDIPSILLYSNTIRWFETQKQLFAGIARLTRRGKLFGNTKARKPQFSRIFKRVQASVCLHKFQATYWSSANKTYGCQFLGENLSHSAETVLTLHGYDDGYHRRPRPVWSMAYMNSEIRKVEIWLYNNKLASCAEEEVVRKNRMYLLSISRVSYNREDHVRSPEYETPEDAPPTHRLVVHDLRGAWTIVNKEVVFALYDLYNKAQMLKRNLSTEALKGLKVEAQPTAHGVSPFKLGHDNLSGSKTSLNKNYAASMLKKLIAESENNPNVVYSEDVESELISDEVRLRGVSACQEDDLIHKKWLIELINSQVVLRGCETSGYVIASASKCQIWQKIHKPVWKERTLLSKETWVGSVDCMQYYATVDAKIDSDVVWLPVDNIQERGAVTVSDLTEIVGSGQRVGGVLSLNVNPDEPCPDVGCPISPIPKIVNTIQLQRIISRCSCQFYYVVFTEDIDLDLVKEIPPVPQEDDLIEPWDKEVAVDSFTLMHTELDVSTNSQQFAMIIDLVNNLLLFVEPHRKEAVEKMQSMRFQFQLSSLEEQREPIYHLQDMLRKLVADSKQSEKECYRIQRLIEESGTDDPRLQRELDVERDNCEKFKIEISDKSDDLALRISCFKEAQVMADKDRERQEAVASGRFVSSVVKRIEVCFKQASWVLTDADGQLQLADVTLRNFLYTKVAKNDDCVEHSLELGFIQVLNRLPNQAYTTVLEPTNLGDNIPLDRRHTLRIFCRERPPVAGIPVKEHFEVNVIPLTIAVTKAFFKRMLKFFFPEPEEEEKPADRRGLRRRRNKQKAIEADDGTASTASGQTSQSNPSSLPSSAPSKQEKEKSIMAVSKHATVTDVDKMRERAQKNQTFVYIKIPEVPVKVSYKGGKSNHISSIDNFTLILPTIEYHNQTWTWLDVLMSIKAESQKRLLAQAVKQKLTIWPRGSSTPVSENKHASLSEEGAEEDRERKTRLLLGNLASPLPVTKSKRLSAFFKK